MTIDDAGQFRVGNPALCWIHAERLLQRRCQPARTGASGGTMRDLVWRYYKALKVFG
jgi:hypothetical protein